MEAMDYEFLMRAVYGGGRNSRNGADADIYRAMEISERVIDDPNWGKSKDDKEYDFRVKFAKVRNYIHDAIAEGMKKIQFEEEEKIELNAILSELSLRFYDKAKLDVFIDRASVIFALHGLKA